MSIRRRIMQVERLVPESKKIRDKEMEQVIEWLVINSDEFKECVRQLFRIKCKTDGGLDELEQSYKQKAEFYMIRINQLIDQHRGSVTVWDILKYRLKKGQFFLIKEEVISLLNMNKKLANKIILKDTTIFKEELVVNILTATKSKKDVNAKRPLVIFK